MRAGDGTLAARPGRNLVASRGAFVLDPAALLAARRAGEALVALYHSHCDAPAAPSIRDHAAWVDARGQPLWPGVEMVIVPVDGGRAGPPRRFGWCPRIRQLVPIGGACTPPLT
ncbi:MAG: Mov34/MPN/PAD-1 family protein [Myxococcales bacterium]|nr:Mov34/MPN/PAD-1 family protein [Myxococcales bacterium]